MHLVALQCFQIQICCVGLMSIAIFFVPLAGFFGIPENANARLAFNCVAMLHALGVVDPLLQCFGTSHNGTQFLPSWQIQQVTFLGTGAATVVAKSSHIAHHSAIFPEHLEHQTKHKTPILPLINSRVCQGDISHLFFCCGWMWGIGVRRPRLTKNRSMQRVFV